MSCMKCGRDIKEGQVFCESCLEVMAKYPVKPGIAIQLPGRKESHISKKSHSKRRQPLPPEEQIHRLKKVIRNLAILWLITLVLLAAMIYPTIEYFTGHAIQLPGQNYTAITSTGDTAP